MSSETVQQLLGRIDLFEGLPNDVLSDLVNRGIEKQHCHLPH